MWPRAILGRLLLLAAILALESELVALIPHRTPVLGLLAPAGMAAFAVFLGLGYSRLKALDESLPFSGRLFTAHLVCLIPVALSRFAQVHPWGPFAAAAGERYVSGAAAVPVFVLLALACIPFNCWVAARRATGLLWLTALLAGVAAWSLTVPFQTVWLGSRNLGGRFLQNATWHSVHAVLSLFLPLVEGDAANSTIGTARFMVSIAPKCSGMEGLGLVLVFTAAWLWYLRKEIRFPQALALIPCALGGVWLLNVARIALLVLIGNAGAREIALVGFHSQAGWMGFAAVALAFSVAAQKLAWVRKAPVAEMAAASDGAECVVMPVEDRGESQATAAYLVPFLAILGASFISKAASGYFEWLYPLRFVAAVLALWSFRREYRRLDWRFGWMAPLAGAAIFLVWIAPVWWTRTQAASPVGVALAGLPLAARLVWIGVRVTAAVVTVPMAEELAFRGYLARRLARRQFDEAPFQRITPLAIALSSVAFGLLHGQHWVAGILAGLVYACVLKFSGRIGDAVAAHVTSNLLLAAWVLARSDWAQW